MPRWDASHVAVFQVPWPTTANQRRDPEAHWDATPCCAGMDIGRRLLRFAR